MRWMSFAVPVLALVVAGACSDGPAPGPQGKVREIPSPAGQGSSAPNLTVGADGRLYLSWVEPVDEGGHRLRFATWQEERWSESLTIATGTGWFVNWADFPAMTALEDGTLAAHWLVKSGESTYAYDIHLAISRDGGLSWSQPVVPHADGTQTEHGFVSLVPTPDGFRVLWLDGRETPGSGHDAHGPGAMTLRSALLDRDGRVGPETLIDDRVCDCCQTDAVSTESGTIVAVYRDRTASEIRDISAATLGDDGWSVPRAVHEDNWLMPACPVNGPAVASAGPGVGVAWFTADERQNGLVQVAFSTDRGVSFEDPIRVDGGSPGGRVDLALYQDGSALVSWLEESEVRLRRVEPSGRLGHTVTVATSSNERASGFPRLALLGDRVFVAWSQPGEPSAVRTAEFVHR
jgi:hypothetical protein